MKTILGFLVAALLIALSPVAHAQTTPLVVYVAPYGDDATLGDTPQTPVATLARAQEIIRYTRNGRHATVHVAPGNYAPTTWGQSHTDIIADTRATIDGQRTAEFGFVIRGSNVTLTGFTIANSLNGIQVSQAKDVTLNGITFYRIGSAYADGEAGYAALHLSNGDRVTVNDSKFGYIINTPGPKASLIHGIYATADSDYLRIRNSRMSYISGDPIKFRNDSDAGEVTATTFLRTGRRAIVQEWYRKAGGETPSYGIVYTVAGTPTLYNGQSAAPTWCGDWKGAAPTQRIRTVR
jgi:hypothetical protein